MSEVTILYPTEDRIIVRVVEAEEQSRGGIYIPDMAKDRPQVGEVLRTGPGKFEPRYPGYHLPVGVSAGDSVMFGKFAGTEIEVDGDKLLLLRATDVLAVVRKVVA